MATSRKILHSSMTSYSVPLMSHWCPLFLLCWHGLHQIKVLKYIYQMATEIIWNVFVFMWLCTSTHYQISLSLFVLFLGKMLSRYLVNLSIDFFFFFFFFCKIPIFENFLVTFASKLSWTTDLSFIHGTHCIVTVL